MNIKTISLLIVANIIGFLGVSLAYNLGIGLGFLDADSASAETVILQQKFFTGTILTWAVCAAFSISFLFLKNSSRMLFLSAPLIIPFAYGLGTLWLAAAP